MSVDTKMKIEFKTVSEAVAYCKRFGLEISPASDILFETATAIHAAVETGIAIGESKSAGELSYVDSRGDRELIERLMKTAEEMGRDTSFLTVNYLNDQPGSNTYNPAKPE